MPGEWPLVGRDVELGLLSGLLRSGDLGGVVLAGPAGVGKTRLASEFLVEAERAGWAVSRVAATRSAAHLPLGALAPLLPPADPSLGGAIDDWAAFLHRACSDLAARGKDRGFLLLVDDAHLLDDASATLIHQLVATRSATVVATVRTEEPTPEPVTALWKDGLADRIDIGGLAPDAMEELLERALGGQVDRAVVALLVSRCGGNVLFLRELVLGAVNSGALANVGSLWRLVGPITPSDRLVELVEARLSTLDDAERSFLDVLSLGEPLGSAELAALGSDALAESLERRGLLASWMDGRRLEIRLAHPLHGEVLRARLPVIRFRTLARELAAVVETTGARRREDILRVATWRLDGGGQAPAELMLAAARIASQRWDFPLAERLARAAVGAGAGFEAGFLAAQMACDQGHSEQAEEAFVPLISQATTDAERGRAAAARMANLTLWMGRHDEAIRAGQEAEASVTDSSWRDDITANRAMIVLLTEGARAGAAFADPLRHRARGRALVWASLVASLTLPRVGRISDALDAANRGEAELVRLDRPPPGLSDGVFAFSRTEALTMAGRLSEAKALAEAEYERAVAEHRRTDQLSMAWQMGRVLLNRGRPATAARCVREAVSLLYQEGRLDVLRQCLPDLAWALALQGRPEEAAAVFAERDAIELPLPGRHAAVEALRSRAWVAVAAGDPTRARQILGDGVDAADDVGDPLGKVIVLYDLARLGHSREVVDRLTAAAAAMEGDLVPAWVAHAVALAASAADALAQVSTRLDAMGAELLAAEAAADAAVAWRRAGDLRRAAAAERRAGVLAARCEGARTPALTAVSARAALSARELEIARLATAGASNKEIAARLYLSVRTVENKLHAAYEKLGVEGRSGLAEALEAF